MALPYNGAEQYEQFPSRRAPVRPTDGVLLVLQEAREKHTATKISKTNLLGASLTVEPRRVGLSRLQFGDCDESESATNLEPLKFFDEEPTVAAEPSQELPKEPVQIVQLTRTLTRALSRGASSRGSRHTLSQLDKADKPFWQQGSDRDEDSSEAGLLSRHNSETAAGGGGRKPSAYSARGLQINLADVDAPSAATPIINNTQDDSSDGRLFRTRCKSMSFLPPAQDDAYNSSDNNDTDNNLQPQQQQVGSSGQPFLAAGTAPATAAAPEPQTQNLQPGRRPSYGSSSSGAAAAAPYSTSINTTNTTASGSPSSSMSGRTYGSTAPPASSASPQHLQQIMAHSDAVNAAASRFMGLLGRRGSLRGTPFSAREDGSTVRVNQLLKNLRGGDSSNLAAGNTNLSANSSSHSGPLATTHMPTTSPQAEAAGSVSAQAQVPAAVSQLRCQRTNSSTAPQLQFAASSGTSSGSGGGAGAGGCSSSSYVGGGGTSCNPSSYSPAFARSRSIRDPAPNHIVDSEATASGEAEIEIPAVNINSSSSGVHRSTYSASLPTSPGSPAWAVSPCSVSPGTSSGAGPQQTSLLNNVAARSNPSCPARTASDGLAYSPFSSMVMSPAMQTQSRITPAAAPLPPSGIVNSRRQGLTRKSVETLSPAAAAAVSSGVRSSGTALGGWSSRPMSRRAIRPPTASRRASSTEYIPGGQEDSVLSDLATAVGISFPSDAARVSECSEYSAGADVSVGSRSGGGAAASAGLRGSVYLRPAADTTAVHLPDLSRGNGAAGCG